ncbi:ribonuclease H protein-like [Dorcoceras hygrometricum]|uniref:Ribonuclease H protein-like n=1 Tax=Dorcoceras hygrometricum TaxID=472368 RepID=A0A2Z7B4S7_9LAMI|nr:ribonuclease H protein-like [Dorcoceras hygrometricum]
MAQEWEIKIKKIFREQNRAADFLATEALKYPLGMRTILNPTTKLLDILSEDKQGIRRMRKIWKK